MKRVGFLLCVMLFLTGCSMKNDDMDRALEFRSKLLNASEVSFCCSVVADYGNQIQMFSMDCQGDSQGNIRFAVTKPETISEITGKISSEGGALTFDDKVLFFTLLKDDQLSPVSTPWIFLKVMQSGYIHAVGTEDEFFRVTLEDSYADDELLVDVWFDAEDAPVKGDILYDGKRILSFEIENFLIR